MSSTSADFDDLWSGFLAGVGPAGAYCVALGPVERQALRSALFARIGEPTGAFSMDAVARCAVGVVPHA
ncbi:MAG: hypothetical protein U0Q03_15895 [Acidimicrobiales bacterium]